VKFYFIWISSVTTALSQRAERRTGPSFWTGQYQRQFIPTWLTSASGCTGLPRGLAKQTSRQCHLSLWTATAKLERTLITEIPWVFSDWTQDQLCGEHKSGKRLHLPIGSREGHQTPVSRRGRLGTLFQRLLGPRTRGPTAFLKDRMMHRLILNVQNRFLGEKISLFLYFLSSHHVQSIV
jgi:hypothetical protein